MVVSPDLCRIQISNRVGYFSRETRKISWLIQHDALETIYKICIENQIFAKISNWQQIQYKIWICFAATDRKFF